MSYEEVQFEEKSVQLIPEDLEILSEYSWDMAGYTSRFGYFYLGNAKADVEGLTRWQAEHIFQLTPIPRGWKMNCKVWRKPDASARKRRRRSPRKTKRLAKHILPGLYGKRIFSISAFISMLMNTGSMQRCISSSVEMAWIHTTQRNFWP